MLISTISSLFPGKKNFVFLGEAGSGKTEISTSFASALANSNPFPVHFFDLDQTKPLFRARDCIMEKDNLFLHYQDQFLDAPTVPPGVNERLSDNDSIVVLDIGGGYYGTHMIGQFADTLSSAETEVFYIVNPYRPWSRTREDIDITMSHILSSSSLKISSVIANPNISEETTVDTVLSGVIRVEHLLSEYPICFVAVSSSLADEIGQRSHYPVFPIVCKTSPLWI